MSALVFSVAGSLLGLTGLPAFASPAVEPCGANSQSRQLDFWIGHWTVTSLGGGSSTSDVSLSLGQCLFIERWDNGRGHRGESLFAYSADDGGWRGLFADNQGRVHVFPDGKAASGSVEFDGPSRGPNGEAVSNRVRLVRKTPDRVEQTWDKSADGGATWKTVFRGEYLRRSASEKTRSSN